MVAGVIVGINGRRRDDPRALVDRALDRPEAPPSAAAMANRAARDREIRCPRCDETFVPRGRIPKDSLCPRCRADLARPTREGKALHGELLGGLPKKRPVPPHLAVSADDAIDGRVETCTLDHCPFDEIHRAHESLDGLRGPRRITTAVEPGAAS